MKSILDRSFRYTPSVETDVRKTFARIRKRIRDNERAQAMVDAEVRTKVLPIDQLKKASSAVNAPIFTKQIESRPAPDENVTPLQSSALK